MSEQGIRVVQMSGSDPEFVDKSSDEIQDDFFLDALPGNKGVYHFRTRSLDAEPGTTVLFQFDSKIIASAMLIGREKYGTPRTIGEVEYGGELRFEPSSISVFDPLTAIVMQTVWPDFDPTIRRMWKLEKEKYPAFLEMRRNIRPGAPLASGDAYTSDDKDERPTVGQQIKARRGSKKFRDGLLKRYGKCLVTGCTITDILEAAHIHPHRGVKDDHLENGLLLRADIHTLFDLYLLAIEPDHLRVELHPSILRDVYYDQFHGKTLDTDEKPSHAELNVRYLEIKRLCK